MTIQELVNNTSNTLRNSGSTTPEMDARVLLEHASGKSRAWLHTHGNESFNTHFSDETLTEYQQLIDKRAQSIPVAYLTGTKEFYGLPFIVSPEVMIPRPESEALVEYVRKNAPKNAPVLDMGTGCGALAIALTYTRPDLDITASDVSPEALAIARRNAERNDATIRFETSDLFTGLIQTFDVIVANLPYLKPDANLTPDSEHEPKLALNGGSTNGLGIYEQFLRQAPEYLHTHGLLVIESDPWQHPELISIAQKHEFTVQHEERFMLVLES